MKKTFTEGKGVLSVANKNGDNEAQLTPKEELAGIIDAYKVQNPAKYAVKKAELEKRLNSL